MAVRRYQGGGQVNTQQMQQEASDLSNLGQPSANWVATHPGANMNWLPPDANAQGIQNASDADMIAMIRAGGVTGAITADDLNRYRNNPSSIPGQFGQYYAVNEPTAQQRQEMTNLSQQESQAIMQGAQPQQQQQGPPQYNWQGLQQLGQQQAAQQSLNPQGGPSYAQMMAAQQQQMAAQQQQAQAPPAPTGSMYNLPGAFAAAPQQPVQQFQGGGQVTQPPPTPMPYSNPLYSITDLGAAALGSVFGTAYGTPVYNPMPNQQNMPGGAQGGGQGGQGGGDWQTNKGYPGMTQGGIYSGPQYAQFGVPAATQQGGVWQPEGGVLMQMPSVFGPGGGPNAPMGGNVGYAQTGNPVYSTPYPGGTNAQWNQVGQAAGLSQADINQFQQQGLTPQQIASRFNVAAPTGAYGSTMGTGPGGPLTATPWATGVGGAQPTATGAPAQAPTPFATAPMPGTVGIPGAQPPPAPGVPPMMAGGGGPGAWAPGVARPTAFGGSTAARAYTAGMPGGAAFQQGFEHGFSGLPKMPPAGGAGMALATGATTAPPQKMQSGGLVQGYQPGGTVSQDPEVPKPTLSVPQTGGGQGSQGGQPAPYTGSVENDPAMSSAVTNVLGLKTNPWHPETSSGMGMGAAASGGASGGGYNVPGGPGGYIGASAGPGQSGFWYPSQAAATKAGDVGTGVGGGGMTPQMGNAIGGAIGNIGAAFQQALNKTANTPWQWQPAGSWANPQNVPKPAPPQVQQTQVPQEQQGRGNAASYMATTAPYMAAYYPGMAANV